MHAIDVDLLYHNNKADIKGIRLQKSLIKTRGAGENPSQRINAVRLASIDLQ